MKPITLYIDEANNVYSIKEDSENVIRIRKHTIFHISGFKYDSMTGLVGRAETRDMCCQILFNFKYCLN